MSERETARLTLRAYQPDDLKHLFQNSKRSRRDAAGLLAGDIDECRNYHEAKTHLKKCPKCGLSVLGVQAPTSARLWVLVDIKIPGQLWSVRSARIRVCVVSATA